MSDDPQLIVNGPEGVRLGLHVCDESGMSQLCVWVQDDWLVFSENESEHLYDLCRAWQRQFNQWRIRGDG